MFGALLQKLRVWRWRRRYRPGTTVSRFIAPDIRRDIQVVNASRVSEGVISARTRTWNVLYKIRLGAQVPDFGDVREIRLADLWRWPGASWGGPVPDGIDEDNPGAAA